MADITMPQLGETVTEGTITRWAKQVGDAIAEDEVLFEVSTDKVDSEVPSPVGGVVSEILVAEGETVDVGTRLAVISAGDGAPSASDAPGQDDASQPADMAEGDAGGGTDGTDQADNVGEPSAQATSPQSAPPSQPAPVAAATAPAPSQVAPSPSASEGLVLSPVVRRLVAEHGLDPSSIVGSGAGGRITRSDVLAVIDSISSGSTPKSPGAQAAQPAPGSSGAPGSSRPSSSAPPAPSAPAKPAFAGATAPVAVGSTDEIVPFTNIRRRTAEHMVRSKQTSAHTMVAVEVDYLGVERVRRAEKDRFRAAEGFGLTYLPFVTRAVVDALEDFPHVNSSVGDDALIVHHELNIGIAVDLDFEGLLVPVVHAAEGKRMRVIAREISDLAARARARRLTMDDISGGTFTITNAGPFGTFITVPVINQPQVAILSTDGVTKKPVAVELPDGSDGIAVHPVGNLVLSWDHRAFDGAYAAAFLKAVKDGIETRDWSGEL